MSLDLKGARVISTVAALEGKSSKGPLAHILKTLSQAFADSRQQNRRHQEDHWPAIIIDEANALTSWSSTHPQELRTLLRFFVAVAKQEQIAHVLLVTSDCTFTEWLAQGELFHVHELYAASCNLVPATI